MTTYTEKAIDRLIDKIERLGNPTALGLDMRVEYLPPSFDVTKDATKAVYDFNRALIDATLDVVPCVKAQVACYEMLGLAGMKVFRDTLLYARERGMITIADVKRNDIGATAEAYAAAYFGPDAAFPADFVTLNPYLGIDGIAPFLARCELYGNGVFSLVRTSNKSAGDFQDLKIDGRRLYEIVGEKTGEWGKDLIGSHGYSSLGAVVGATWPEESKKLRTALPHTFFLVPGYGAQGATAKDLSGCFDAQGRGAVINASRSLLLAYKKRDASDFAAATRDEAVRMRDEIRKEINIKC
ncbi:orotidine 5'-phosphate decarboxylase [Synergistales bacterium]|nr:orotidine 5'-phosphate decarboxylase [Synergistales bacterium]